MLKVGAIITFLTITTILYAQGGWVRQTGTGVQDICSAIATDREGNVYTCSYSSSDIVLSKYLSNGTQIWSKSYAEGGRATITSMVVDSKKNIFITGYFWGSIGIDTFQILSAGNYDVLLVKCDSEGNPNWVRRGGGEHQDVANGIALDSSSNIYVGGYFVGNSTFGKFQIQSHGTPQNIFYADPMVIVYNSEGSEVNVVGASTYLQEIGTSVAVSHKKEVFLGGLQISKVPDVEVTDIYRLKFDSNLAMTWDHLGTGHRYAAARGIAVDQNGNAYAAGYYDRVLRDETTKDIFVLKYSLEGPIEWFRGVEGKSPNDAANAIAIDNFGYIYVTGVFHDTVSFGNFTLVSTGRSDIFAVKYSPEGDVLWAKQAGGEGDDVGMDLCTDIYGNIFVTGTFTAKAKFERDSLVSKGLEDVFVWKIGATSNVKYQSTSEVQSEIKSIFPNPSNNVIIAQVVIRNVEYIKVSAIGVFGTTSILFEGMLQGGTHDLTLDISGLRPGCYSLVLTSPHGHSISRFVVL